MINNTNTNVLIHVRVMFLSHRYFCSQCHIFAELALTVYDNQYFLEHKGKADPVLN